MINKREFIHSEAGNMSRLKIQILSLKTLFCDDRLLCLKTVQFQFQSEVFFAIKFNTSNIMGIPLAKDKIGEKTKISIFKHIMSINLMMSSNNF